MTFHILANLDQEVRWLGIQRLSGWAQRTISAYASLLAVLAPSDDVVVWAPTLVDPERLVRSPGWRPPQLRTGTPPHVDLCWADPHAESVNDRRFALHLAREFACALPGARVIQSIAELEHHLATGGAAASHDASWVCKALWSSAGRDRVYGQGQILDGQQRTQLRRLLESAGHAVVFEPWLSRIFDVAVSGYVATSITVNAPHGLVSSRRGGFVGIDISVPHSNAGNELSELTTPRLLPPEHAALTGIAHRVAVELLRSGYRGPFGIDAFVYRDGDARRLHPLCEINARHTFGHIAHALAARLGTSSLRIGQPAPDDAVELVRPSPADSASAWVISDPRSLVR